METLLAPFDGERHALCSSSADDGDDGGGEKDEERYCAVFVFHVK